MNMPLAILNRRRRGFTAFSPSALFALAEPGVWYDPSDVANLNWRVNLLTWTEDFTNAVWTKGAGATATATTLRAVAGTGNHWLYASNVALAVQTFSIEARADTASWIALGQGNTGSAANTFFNLSTGTVGTVSTGHTASIVNLGGGWYRCIISQNFGLAFASVSVTTADNVAINYNAVGTEQVSIRNAQLELGTVATTYQPITTVDAEVSARFPNATLYQDDLGVSPVTTPGQTVGLMLDKSKGLVLGSELVSNGTFDSGTAGWSDITAVLSVVGGEGLVTAASGFGYVRQVITTVVGKTYQVTCSARVGTTNKVTFSLGGAAAETTSSTTTSLRLLYTATGTSANLWLQINNAGTAYFDNISVRELPGNHAVQATFANRPLYGIVPFGGRRNLLTYSEEFGDSAWAKLGVTVSTTQYTAPNGTLTADALVPTGTGFNIQRAFSINISGTYTASVSVKDNGAGSCMVAMGTGTIGYLININLTTGAFISGRGYGGGVLVGYTITSQGNGWWRVAVSATASVGGVSVSSADGTSPTTGILIWGAQLETGSTATAYQRVTTQYDVTEAGVQSCSYLFFNGTNNSMATGTITPGTDKVQVFAGVRKLNLGQVGIIFETSAAAESNAGAFRFGRDSSGYEYFIGSGGTIYQQVLTDNSAFDAPVTNTLTGLFDISAPFVTVKANGTQIGQNTVSQGTGNFLPYPLYLGMRQGATPPSSNSLFFNGQLFGLITRFGPNLDTTTINATEYWLNEKTGAY